jgi:hypothetical protein
VLGCAEGREAVITAEYLHATDGDSEDGGLTWLIARQPYHGVVLRGGAVVDRFVQADLAEGAVSYRHTGRRTGGSSLGGNCYFSCCSYSFISVELHDISCSCGIQ